MMTFANKLEALRNKFSLDKEELANRIEVKSSDVEDWEAGKTIPDYDTRNYMTMLFGVDINAFFVKERKNDFDMAI